MRVVSSEVHCSTRGNADILDLTSLVADAIMESEIREGVCVLFTPSSTSSLTTIEYEPGCLEDLKRIIERIVPSSESYAHNARWGDSNGHSHVRAALLGPSVVIPIRQGKLTLGTWQQIILVDFDNRPRQRKVLIQILGL